MTTDEEKSRLAKLLSNLEVTETKLSERCSDLVHEFHKQFGRIVEEEEGGDVEEVYENPYRVDSYLLIENERKLKKLLSENKRYLLIISICK